MAAYTPPGIPGLSGLEEIVVHQTTDVGSNRDLGAIKILPGLVSGTRSQKPYVGTGAHPSAAGHAT
jgi:hypothetical protein